ncbi:MAG: DUF1385 domain-containing protein [Coriobacteriia bacterium]|nr:DUF1385 domain-containing protein [Coriobacteriia bacterium]
MSTSEQTTPTNPTFDGIRGYEPIPIGGQAVLEGVMMRGKKFWAVAARDEQGEIHVEEFPLKSAAARNAWMRLPIIRGIVALGESLALGTKSLTISARIAGLEEEVEGKDRESAMTNGMIATSVIMGIALAVFIFILLPATITAFVMGGSAQHGFSWNLFDGVLRVVIFFGYVYAISRIPDIKRVFRFHGAEHKVIQVVEAGEDLTVENARKYSTLHPRCGTAFLIMVMALAILVFSLVPVSAIVSALGITNYVAIVGVRIVSRLALLPIVAGLAYEITVKWASRNTHLKLVQIIMWPGLQMQRMTTGEPDDDMIEVALTSTRAVLAAEQGMIAMPEAEEAEVAAVAADVEEAVLPAEFDLLDDEI